MARNSITYEGRIHSVDKDTREPVPLDLTESANGTAILRLVVAERHSMKKGRAEKDPNLKKYAADERNANKGADDYINTTTSWHKITIMGDKALEYAQDADFNHSALVVVKDASYTEEEPWETKQDGKTVLRAGRAETIGDYNGELEIKFAPYDDIEFGPTWDGESEIPKAGGGGGRKSSSAVAPEDGF